MALPQILFILFGAITLGAALIVVTRRNTSQAALFLLLSLLGVAGLYMLLEAPLLAAAQLLFCVTGVAVPIILVATLTPGMTPGTLGSSSVSGANRQWAAAVIVAVLLCDVLGWIVISHDWGIVPTPASADSVVSLGKVLLAPQGFVLPFAVATALLLVALVGATITVREE